MTAKQKKAVEALQRTLNGIDEKKFWKRVMDRVSPKHDANALVRARSIRDIGRRYKESDAARHSRIDRWFKLFDAVQRRTAKSVLQLP